MTKKRRTYLPRIVGTKVMMPADLKCLHKYMLEVDRIGDQYDGQGVPKVRGKISASVRDPDAVSKGSSPGSQKASLAEGGSSHGMVKRQAADTAPPGRTSKPQSAADPKQASGGLARPARAGSCGT